MAKFYVGVREVHVALYSIEAPENVTKEKLIELTKIARDRGESEDFTEYSHTLSSDTWDIEKVK